MRKPTRKRRFSFNSVGPHQDEARIIQQTPAKSRKAAIRKMVEELIALPADCEDLVAALRAPELLDLANASTAQGDQASGGSYH